MSKNELGHGSEPRITPKMQALIDAFVIHGAKTITAAAMLAGMSREHATRTMQKAHFARALHSKVSEELGLASAQAARTMIRLLGSKSDYVQLEAANSILDRTGHAPKKDEAPPAPPIIFKIDLTDPWGEKPVGDAISHPADTRFSPSGVHCNLASSPQVIEAEVQDDDPIDCL